MPMMLELAWSDSAWTADSIPLGASSIGTLPGFRLEDRNDAAHTSRPRCAASQIEMMSFTQGPALYVYNSATFKEADFESISNIGDSGKAKDAKKTGRFG